MVEARHRDKVQLDLTAAQLTEDLAPIYTYVKELGAGSFGRVILCEDTRLGNRPVAVKLLPRGVFVS